MFFSLSFYSHTLFDLCVCVCQLGLRVCACMCVCGRVNVKLCMCVLILVAASRSYSRSTGALHTPDTFGAAGEGWVLLLRTSPTHVAFICVRSLTCFLFVLFGTEHLLLNDMHFFSSCPFFSYLFICIFCSRMSNLPVELHVSAL